MQYPSCRREIALGLDECLFCGSEVPVPVEEQIRRRFACTRCRHREAAMARVTMLGREGDLAVLERGGGTGDVLDLLFPT